jgi:antitoxin HigA-1
MIDGRYFSPQRFEPTPPSSGSGSAEVAESGGHTKTEIAKRQQISRQRLYELPEGRKPVSAFVAARLGKLFGNDGVIWLRMQAARDLSEAERDCSLADIEPLDAH